MSNKWTKLSEDELRALYPVIGIRGCAKHFNRTTMAIQKKAGRLNLKAPGLDSQKGNPTKTHEEYEEEILNLDLPGYPIEPYKGAKTPILHTCENEHTWLISPDNFLRGRTCPYCSNSGFQLDKPGRVYYIKIGDYYKVGITNLTVAERFKRESHPIRILKEWYFDVGAKAKELESQILLEFSSKRVRENNYLVSGGNTELFSEDILQYDSNL